MASVSEEKVRELAILANDPDTAEPYSDRTRATRRDMVLHII